MHKFSHTKGNTEFRQVHITLAPNLIFSTTCTFLFTGIFGMLYSILHQKKKKKCTVITVSGYTNSRCIDLQRFLFKPKIDV